MTNTANTDSRETIPRPEHPRPDFMREDWKNLNGVWNFDFDDEDLGEAEKWFAGHDFGRKITVPFCYQSKLSGNGEKSHHEIVWYAREFIVPEKFAGKRIFLHFGAVDYRAKVWLDGNYLGEHTGGYLPFRFDITNLVSSGDERAHTVAVRAEDSRSRKQPRGKQNWKDEPWGCWYTPVTGIWQTVWLEAVGTTFLERVQFTPDVDSGSVHMEAYINRVTGKESLRLILTYDGRPVREVTAKIGDRCIRLTVDLRGTETGAEEIHYWYPDHPCLYDATILLYDGEDVADQVAAYFGMRKIQCRDGWIYLNNSPLFQKLILDQGYWRDSLLTPSSDEAIQYDIRMTKRFGFNGARKHQKIEDPRYYYWADRIGLLIWGEIPSAYEFCTEEMENLFHTAKGFIERDYNHPCIITWVPLNESWGVRNICANREQQQFADGLYKMMKALDRTRMISTNDGWEYPETDIIGIHDYTAWGRQLSRLYEDKERLLKGAPNKGRNILANGYSYREQPILCTEYGGIAFTKDSGSGNWGYNGAVENEEKFLERLKDITQAFRNMPYICGYCYTQLTDVFQEVNGLMDMDRNPKIDPAKVAEII